MKTRLTVYFKKQQFSLLVRVKHKATVSRFAANSRTEDPLLVQYLEKSLLLVLPGTALFHHADVMQLQM